MKRLLRCQHLLYVLKTAKNKLRRNILKEADPDLIKALCDCSVNVLNGNIDVGVSVKKKLKKYKKDLRAISCPKRKLSLKRKLIIQRGGFLPTLLGALLNGVVGTYLKRQ